MLSLAGTVLEEEYTAFAGAYKVVTLVYNPLPGGLLTGKHRSRRQPSAGRFAESENYRNRYWSAPQMAAVDRLTAIAKNQGMSLIALSLRWLLARRFVDGVILGASSASSCAPTWPPQRGPRPTARPSRPPTKYGRSCGTPSPATTVNLGG